jgi:hypothetical protein
MQEKTSYILPTLKHFRHLAVPFPQVAAAAFRAVMTAICVLHEV